MIDIDCLVWCRTMKKNMIIVLLVIITTLGCLFLGLMSISIVSRKDRIDVEKVYCRYLSSDSPIEKIVITNLLDKRIFYNKGMNYGIYEYVIDYSKDGQSNHLVLRYLKTNALQMSNIRIEIDSISANDVNVKVFDKNVMICDGLFDSSADIMLEVGP